MTPSSRSRPEHRYIRFICPLLSRESRHPNHNTNKGPRVGSSPLGWPKHKPHLPWHGAQPRDLPPGPWPGPLVPYACGAGQRQHQRGGRSPRERRLQPSLPAGRSTSTSACSGLQPPDLQRQAPRGGHHQVALSADLQGWGHEESGVL